MKSISMIALFVVFTQKIAGQEGFTVYNAWDFENRNTGAYTMWSIQEDFDVYSLFDHNSGNIVLDNINGLETKVLRITHPANEITGGFDCEAWLGAEYEELYMSYNFKFSNEFNSTEGGKLPGLKGSPYIYADKYPTDDEGWVVKNMFKEAGKLITYHYDRTKPGEAPWGSGTYNYNVIYLNNGQWYNVTRRVVVNTFTGNTPNADGLHEVWIDGRLLYQETGLILKAKPTAKSIDQVHIAHWYGGSGTLYTPLNECYGYIDNIKVWVNKNDPTLNTHNTHDPDDIFLTPDEITDRTVHYDRLITTAGTLQNTEYGGTYSPCIDETYLIDAGTGNMVSYKLNWSIGDRDYLFFYDGNRSDSKLIRMVAGYENINNQIITSSGRYLFVRFSSDTEDQAMGFTGTLSFIQGNYQEIINNAPKIDNQVFIIKENEFTNNYIGKIQAYDLDAGQTLSYAITAGNESNILTLNKKSGELSASTKDLFASGNNTIALTIEVTDNGNEIKSSSAIIEVNFIGDPTIVYIDPDNQNDLSEDGSIDHPYDSWQDIAWKENSTYLQKRGTKASTDKVLIGANNISIGAYGAGELPIIASQTNNYLINGYDKSNIMLTDLHLISENAVGCIYFLGSNSDNIIIEHCTIEGNNAVRITDGKKITIKYNIIKGKNEGLNSTAVTTEVYYNIFKNNKTAVNVMSKLSYAKVYNNVFVDNQEAISVSFADLTIYNNIFYLTSADQKALKKGSNPIASDHNIFYPEQDGFIEISDTKYNKLDQLQQELKLDLNSLNSDPLFVDMYNDDFTIDNSSPAINAGINLNIEKDYYGESVPNYFIPDIGIAEFSGILFRQKRPSDTDPVLTIFPNPSSGILNITVDIADEANIEKDPESLAESKYHEINVIDISGKTILTRLFEHTEAVIQETIDLKDVSDGFYFVVLKMADKIVTEKLFLNR
jgi:hypothetical protein